MAPIRTNVDQSGDYRRPSTHNSRRAKKPKGRRLPDPFESTSQSTGNEPEPDQFSKSEVGGVLTVDQRVGVEVENLINIVPLGIVEKNCIPDFIIERRSISPDERGKHRTILYDNGSVEENQSIVARYHKSKLNLGSTEN